MVSLPWLSTGRMESRSSWNALIFDVLSNTHRYVFFALLSQAASSFAMHIENMMSFLWK